MGYWRIAVTPENFELKNESGKTIASVKGLANARRFSKSWEYEQLLKELAETLRGAGGAYSAQVHLIEKVLGHNPGTVTKEGKEKNEQRHDGGSR